jgi:cell division GTPase FtsZ
MIQPDEVILQLQHHATLAVVAAWQQRLLFCPAGQAKGLIVTVGVGSSLKLTEAGCM